MIKEETKEDVKKQFNEDVKMEANSKPDKSS